MQQYSKKPGMTLIEIIVSVAILGILIIVFSNLFLNSLTMTKRSGDRESTTVSANTEMDRALNDSGYANPGVVNKGSDATITLKYSDNSTRDIVGTPVTVTTANSNGQSIVVKGFLVP